MTEVAAMNELHLTLAEMEAGLDVIRHAPRDNGTLESIVIRPAREERRILRACELSPEQGVHGDNWNTRGTPKLKAQVTLMNWRFIKLLAPAHDRYSLAGDQLFVDLDLSLDNLQPGQRLEIGSALLEITDEPHTGCAKFSRRFGPEALAFVNSEAGSQLRLRGIYATVIQAGTVRVGDAIIKRAS